MFTTYVMSKEAGHCSESARMRMGLKKRSIQREFAGIEAERGPGLFKRISQVILAGYEIKSACLCLVCEDEIEQSIKLWFLFGLRHFPDRFPVIFLQGWVYYSRDENSRASSAIQIEVFPILMVCGHF